MGYQQIGKLIDQWINDTEFRKQLRRDPEAAIQKAKVKLTPEEWSAIKKIDWKQSDQELQALISKPLPGL